MSKTIITFILIALFSLTGYSPSSGSATKALNSTIGITKHPSEVNNGISTLSSLPTYDPNSHEGLQIDLRSYDLTKLDLENRYDDLIYANFDSKTKWPSKLPSNFNPDRIMELGKNPGLQIRELHKKGITGNGVSIAIIDNALLVDHAEYKDNLKMYEEINWPDDRAQMHGLAVASVAVGKTVGVAPGSDLYFIGELSGDIVNGKFVYNYTWAAKSIDRILEVNETLPSNKKIRVISISLGFQPMGKGYNEAMEAIARAQAKGIFVITSSLEDTYGFLFNGLGRKPYNDPDNFESYEPGLFWANSLKYASYNSTSNKFGIKSYDNTLLVPMDSRTVASPTGVNDYAFYRDGGLSWTIPYIAGLYALACQVKPDMTPEKFWNAALKTGDICTYQKGGKNQNIGKIVNPLKLIEGL